MAVKALVDRYAGTVIITLLLIVGIALMLSLNVGGIVFGLGCWVAAYVVVLLQRAVSALEDVTNMQVQTIRNTRQPVISKREDTSSAAASSGG